MQESSSVPLIFADLMQHAFIFFPWSCLGGLILLYWPDVYDDSTVQRLWRSHCCLCLHGPV